jgi:hypothetical protein
MAPRWGSSSRRRGCPYSSSTLAPQVQSIPSQWSWLSRRMLAAAEKRPPQVDEPGTVEAKGLDGRPAFDCEANNPGEVVTPNEMVAPEIAPRMEKGDHFCCHRIDSLDLRVFMIVTTLTSES